MDNEDDINDIIDNEGEDDMVGDDDIEEVTEPYMCANNIYVKNTKNAIIVWKDNYYKKKFIRKFLGVFFNYRNILISPNSKTILYTDI